MHRKTYIYRYLYKIRYGLLLIAMIVVLLYSSITVQAAGMPGGNVSDPVIHAVDLAKPAVVRIITTVDAQLTVTISGSPVTFPQAASASTDGTNYPVQVSGTGTFITSQGDILTADHVINPPKDQTLDQGLYQIAASDVASYMNQHGSGGSQATADSVTQQLTSGQLVSQTKYGTTSSTAFLSTDYTGPLTASSFSNLPTGVALQVDRIEKESPVTQADTAVIHVPLTDSPAVALGDSSTVHELDTLTIIGFPGAADVNTSPTDILTSSVNTITVSSTKTTQSGAPLIQVGGNVEHGDSGGPALDNQGNVVGIVSFGSAEDSGQTSFLQASSSAQTMITSLKLNTKPGKFEQLWTQAFSDYATTTSGHWHQAAQELGQLASGYPLFQAVQPYLTYAQAQAKNEQPGTPVASTPTPIATTSTPAQTGKATKAAPISFSAIALTIGAVVLLLLLSVALFGVSLRQRKKAAQAEPKPAENKAPPAAPTVQPTPSAPATTKGPVTPLPPTVPGQDTSQQTLQLRVWPCGHMNRPNARFCSVCGEPSPD